MNTLPIPAAVIRLSSGPRHRLALATLGVSVPFAAAAVGGYAAGPHVPVRSVPIRVTIDAIPELSEGWSRPWRALVADAADVAGDRFPVETLPFFSPSAGLVLVGLVALVSLGLVWLGQALDWEAPRAGRTAWDGTDSTPSSPTLRRSQVVQPPVRLKAQQLAMPRTLPT